MSSDEAQHTFVGLEPANAKAEIHPIDPLRFQGNVVLKNLGHALWHGHRRLRLMGGPCGPPTTEVDPSREAEYYFLLMFTTGQRSANN